MLDAGALNDDTGVITMSYQSMDSQNILPTKRRMRTKYFGG